MTEILILIIAILLVVVIMQGRQRKRDLEIFEMEKSQLTRRLTEEYSSQMMDKQTKLSALQSQINPHFLYNTLECIRSEALMYDCDSIAKMAKALASFFRYSISKKETLVTLREEIANIENYFLIQRYRFDDKFDFEIRVEPDDRDIYSCLIPKLSLQPIVENAIFHGLETKKEKGEIIIRVETTEDKVLIVVSDNGVGIQREEVERIRLSLKNPEEGKRTAKHGGNGIALSNVSQRLKLIFGEEFGVDIYSVYGTGTDVELIFPIVMNRDEL